MNLTDLRDELTVHADDLGPAPDFRAGVAARVRRTKRRRAVTGAAATLAVAALAVGVLTDVGRPAPTVPAGTSGTASKTVPMIGSDGMPYRAVPDARGDVVKNGLRYRAQVGDDTLAAGFIGDAGQGQFTIVWDVRTTHVSVGAECYLPALSDDAARAYMVSVGLEGKEGFFGSQCSGRRPEVRDLPPGGATPGEPGQGWSDLTVGTAARLRVQLVDAHTKKPAAVDGALLTGAVYEQGPRQDVVDASGQTVASLPAVLEHQGYRYRFLAMQAGPGARTPLPHLATPAGVPFLVTAGSTGSDTSPDAGTTYVTGLDQEAGATSGGWQTIPQPARAAGTVGLRTEGKAPTGTAFVAVYVPEH
ncbi:hypothetical protein [Intrasporangium sp. YIM S08009]|uniref:hypothetical protein n=1 Tax=Intrasporangium zincisolvens TaxID=3080018 RepID=UPI002B05C652|nr:hypothetical protein [Intrasporangium sp. YIM S08009]